MTIEEILAIQEWFYGRDFPTPVTICQGHVVSDVKKMVASHVGILKSKIGEKGYLPYYNRLVELRKLIENSGV